MSLLRNLLTACLAAAPLSLLAADQDADLARGKQLHRQCALCHGLWSQGIIGGKYPRLAGYPEYYLKEMIEKYKSGELDYPAMTVVGGLRNLTAQDVDSMVAYIASIDLAEHAPLNIPTPEGDVAAGEEMYQADCKTCHGRLGEGKSRKQSPPLRGQYVEYLERQIEMFAKKQRVHADDVEDETFVDYSRDDIRNMLAYIATLDDE